MMSYSVKAYCPLSFGELIQGLGSNGPFSVTIPFA